MRARLGRMITSERPPRNTPNAKRDIFPFEYLVDRNATQAAKRSGYSERTAKQQGSRLLTKVDIRAAIADLERKQAEVSAVSVAFVLAGIRAIATDESASNSDRLRAYELSGKHLGMWIERSESLIVHDVAALREYTPAQLRAMLAEAGRQQVIEAESRVIEEGE